MLHQEGWYLQSRLVVGHILELLHLFFVVSVVQVLQVHELILELELASQKKFIFMDHLIQVRKRISAILVVLVEQV